MDKRTERAIWTAWEYIKLIGVLAFAMAAGAATYHQYLIQRHMLATPAPIKIERAAGQIQLPEARLPEVQLPEAAGPIQEETLDDLAGEAEMDELELLAVCVEAEAGNQGLEGKRLVVDVILNRVDDPDFPDTIAGVISQPYHFTSYWDGGMDRVADISEETIQAVRMELENRGWPGVLYFTAETWPVYGTPWKQVGDHFFNTR